CCVRSPRLVESHVSAAPRVSVGPCVLYGDLLLQRAAAVMADPSPNPVSGTGAAAGWAPRADEPGVRSSERAMADGPQTIVAVLGPTATGKSALALTLAERYGGEVISCDSTAVYRSFDIGTDKVPVAERRGVPHHLIDIVEPTEIYTAAR